MTNYNKKRNYLFTSESVTEGHPDKVSDAISDAILDACLKEDPNSRVACETLVTVKQVILAGEITSRCQIKEQSEYIVRQVIKEIGYTDYELGFDFETTKFIDLLQKQAFEIRDAVDLGGAGDQGLMFGFACNETPKLMPLPISLAHQITFRLAELRKDKTLAWLRPDGKSQVTIEYMNGKPIAVRKVVVSAQHHPSISQTEIREAIIEEVVKPILPLDFTNDNIEYLINPSGSFTVGGPAGDTGLTGRKIIVDTYGGSCPHGGGAFSGKDPSKVDRSAAYAARYIAKNIVAANLAEKCLVQISYAIGQAEPVSFMLDFQGTGQVSETEIEKIVSGIFDLTPRGIINSLDLLRPIYQKTTNYGHLGRELPEFTWEGKGFANALLTRMA
jgi:S-adenosylmethionine synthetase